MKRRLLLQIIIAVAWTNAHPAISCYPSVRTVERRQAIPPASTSSYDYWWPYPAWDASSAAAPTASPTYLAAPITASPITTDLLSAIVPSSSLSVGPPNTDLAAINSISATSSPASLATPQPLTTSSASPSIITITALPPGVNPRRHYNHSNVSAFRPGYLAGVFVVAGAIVGFVFSWIMLAIIRRCASSRPKAFIAGAPYSMPPEGHEASEATSDIHESASRFLGVPSPERRMTLTGGVDVGRQGSWLQRAFASHRREGARSRADSAAEVIANVEESFAREEDAPFLAPISQERIPVRTPSSRSRRAPGREGSMLERNVRSPQELEENPELDNAPFNTLRHKSIRRGIIGRIQQGSHYRKGHKRVDSDATVEDTRSSEGGESVLTAAFSQDSPIPERGASRPHSASMPLPLSHQTTSGPGFRIIEEDPDTESHYSHSSSRPGQRLTQALRSSTKSSLNDGYTALPVRLRSPERRSNTGSRVADLVHSSASPKRIWSPKLLISPVDSSVLPASPPMVTSPPLEAELFFGTSPSFGSAPHLDFTMSHESVSDIYKPQEPMQRSRETIQGAHKLQTQRDPPHLPFPSSPQFSQPKHLTKNMPRTSPCKSREARPLSTSDSSATTPAQRYARPQGVLNKVEEILAQSWSERELRGEERTASPTMFGAISQEPEKRAADGIEQRLFQARV